MPYMVTGGTGLIGSRVVRDLARDGQQVVVYDLFPEGSMLDYLLTGEEKARVKIVRGDVTDLPLLIHTAKENRVDRVIHLASLLSPAADANPPLGLKVISEGTVNIFEMARIMEMKKVVWISSSSVYGSIEKYGGKPIPNDAPHYPVGVYGACKDLNENLAAFYFVKYGLDINSIRYTLVYGAGQERGGSGAIVRELIIKPAMGQPGKVPNGDDTLNFLYVDDAAHVTVLAARAVRTKTRSYCTSGDIRTIKEVAEYVRKLLPGADITLLPGAMGIGWEFDTSRVEQELGFKAKWKVEQGVRDIIDTTRRLCGLPPV